MDTGRNTKEIVDAVHVEALALLIATVRRHRGFFAGKSAEYHVRLLRLMRSCRPCLRRGEADLARDIVTNELFCLFGVRVTTPTRYLLLLASLLRFIVVDAALAGHRLVTRGGVNVLIRFLNRQLASMAGATNNTKPIDLPVLDSLLVQLAQQDAEAVVVLELHYFAGFSARDICLAMGADTDVAAAMARGKAWLVTTIGGCQA